MRSHEPGGPPRHDPSSDARHSPERGVRSSGKRRPPGCPSPPHRQNGVATRAVSRPSDSTTSMHAHPNNGTAPGAVTCPGSCPLTTPNRRSTLSVRRVQPKARRARGTSEHRGYPRTRKNWTPRPGMSGRGARLGPRLEGNRGSSSAPQWRERKRSSDSQSAHRWAGWLPTRRSQHVPHGRQLVSALPEVVRGQGGRLHLPSFPARKPPRGPCPRAAYEPVP